MVEFGWWTLGTKYIMYNLYVEDKFQILVTYLLLLDTVVRFESSTTVQLDFVIVISSELIA